MIQANGVELCTESFGDPAHPPLLLIMGIGASMLWWEEGFCRMLADGGRFVIRYDHRDTGRSVTYEPGRPTYTGRDLVDDALGVLDAYGLPAAHVVGVSAGGAFAQLLALDHPGRVLSLVLVSTSRATAGGPELPPPTDEFIRFVTDAEVDWSDPASVVEYLVEYWRVLAGDRRPFDERAFRDLARRDVARARDFAAAQNHDLLGDDGSPRRRLASIAAPTLVIHGDADPMFPMGHGEALADEIPGATLLRLEGAGHGIYRQDWSAVVGAIVRHTGKADTSSEMQPRGVSVVREIVEALNRRDVDAMLARMDTNFEWTPLEESPVSRICRGHEQVRRYVEDWLSTFDDLRLELGEPSAVGDHVIVVVRGHARGRASGVPLYNSFCQVWTVRGGAALRMQEYPTREEGLAALR